MTAISPSRTVASRSSQSDLAERSLVAYVFVVPFGSSIASPLPSPVDDLSSVAGAAASVLLLARLVTRRDMHRTEAVAPFVWVLFLALMMLSWFWSIVPSATFTSLIVAGSLIGQATIAAVQRYSDRFFDDVMRALAASGAVNGVVAVYQQFTNTLGESGTAGNRFQLVGNDPNITAAAVLLPLAAALVLAQQPDTRRLHRLLWLVGAGLTLWAIMLTKSRGGLLGVAAIFVFAVLRNRGPRAWLAMITGVIAAIPFLPASDRGTESTGRTSIWRVAIESCTDRCWVGAGEGSFPDVYEGLALARPELAANQLRFEAHNIFIGALVEVGFVGAFLLVMIFGMALTSAFRAPGPAGKAIFAGVLAVLVANLLVTNLGFKYTWLALVLASLVGAQRESQPPQGTSP